MAQLKVQQKRGLVGLKANQRETLRSLGLKRIGDVVVKEDRPEIRGMVHTVRHLVTVEALRMLEEPEHVAARRGLRVEDVAPRKLLQAKAEGIAAAAAGGAS
jgi:large subunit ribosomal protein L30